MSRSDWPGIHSHALPLVEQLVENAAALRIEVSQMDNGVRLVDAGIKVTGGLEAGRRIAEICMAGLGSVSYLTGGVFARWPLSVHVHSSHPVAACLGSQYAGWSLSHGEGKTAFHALGSGPGRSLAVKEPLFKELNYRDQSAQTCLVLEVDKSPPPELTEKILRDCDLESGSDLTLILTPTRSLAGMTQVVSRVLEVALHKLHELGFPLEKLVDGAASAPVPPPASDFVQAMGRSNDAILFGGQVQLYVNCPDAEAAELAEKLPSSSSSDYGKPFAEVFKHYEYDFFKIDPMLFSPATAVVTNLQTGNSFHAGALDEKLLEKSFGEKS